MANLDDCAGLLDNALDILVLGHMAGLEPLREYQLKDLINRVHKAWEEAGHAYLTGVPDELKREFDDLQAKATAEPAITADEGSMIQTFALMKEREPDLIEFARAIIRLHDRVLSLRAAENALQKAFEAIAALVHSLYQAETGQDAAGPGESPEHFIAWGIEKAKADAAFAGLWDLLR